MLVEEAKIKAVEVEKKVAGADAFAEQVRKSPFVLCQKHATALEVSLSIASLMQCRNHTLPFLLAQQLESKLVRPCACAATAAPGSLA